MNKQAIETIKARIDELAVKRDKVLDNWSNDSLAGDMRRRSCYERRLEAIACEVDGLEFALEALGVHGYVDRDFEC